MAICRFSDTDVYLWPREFGFYECSLCNHGGLTVLSGRVEEHLLVHKEAGDNVPEYVLARARRADDPDDDFVGLIGE